MREDDEVGVDRAVPGRRPPQGLSGAVAPRPLRLRRVVRRGFGRGRGGAGAEVTETRNDLRWAMAPRA